MAGNGTRFLGTCYRAANWIEIGATQGCGHRAATWGRPRSIKKMLGLPLHRRFREILIPKSTEPLFNGSQQFLPGLAILNAESALPGASGGLHAYQAVVIGIALNHCVLIIGRLLLVLRGHSDVLDGLESAAEQKPQGSDGADSRNQRPKRGGPSRGGSRPREPRSGKENPRVLNPAAKVAQEDGDPFHRQGFVLTVIVALAERHDAPPAFKSVKLEFLEGKRGDFSQQAVFLVMGNYVPPVSEAFRQMVRARLG